MAALEHEELRTQVAEACRELLRLGLGSGAAGNVSARVPGTGLVAVSPSGLAYPAMTAADVPLLDLRTGATSSPGQPASSELPMHLAVLHARPDAGSVVHAHGVQATALGLLGRGIPPITDEQVAVLGGAVELAPHAAPGSEELAQLVVAHLGDRRAVLLRHHGMLGVGRDLAEALTVCALTERLAGIVLATLPHGPLRLLPAASRERERRHYEQTLL